EAHRRGARRAHHRRGRRGRWRELRGRAAARGRGGGVSHCPNYPFPAMHPLTALIWAIVAADGLRLPPQRRVSGRPVPMIPILGACTSFVFALSTVFTLIPTEIHLRQMRVLVPLYTAGDVSSLVSIALFRHMSRYFGVRELPPGRGWLAVNYGSAALVA